MGKLKLVTPARRKGAPPAQAQPAVPDDIRDRLSPVVLDVYSSGDFHRADMRSLAREAGMSFGTIYRYFSGKEALLFWFIDHWFQDLYPHATDPLADVQAGIAAGVRECLRRHLAYYERHPKVGRIVFMTVPLERWMRDDTYHQHEVMRALLGAFAAGQQSGELRTDVTPVAMLDAFVALFTRAFLMWEYRRRKYSLEAQADTVFTLLWGGISAPPPAPAARGKGAKR